MDIKMPRLDGIAATRAILQENPETHVIVLTTFETDDLVFEAILAGQGLFAQGCGRERNIGRDPGAVRGEPAYRAHRRKDHLRISRVKIPERSEAPIEETP